MHWVLSVNLQPVRGGWASNDTRLVSSIGIEAPSFDEALTKARRLLPEAIPEDAKRTDMPYVTRRHSK